MSTLLIVIDPQVFCRGLVDSVFSREARDEPPVIVLLLTPSRLPLSFVTT